MLAQTLRAALSQAEQAGAGRLIRSELRAGWGKIRFMPRGGDGRAAQVFATVRAGFALLADFAERTAGGRKFSLHQYFCICRKFMVS